MLVVEKKRAGGGGGAAAPLAPPLNPPMLNDNELLQAEDLLYKKFPIFSVHFDEYIGVCSATSAQDPYDTGSSKV